MFKIKTLSIFFTLVAANLLSTFPSFTMEKEHGSFNGAKSASNNNSNKVLDLHGNGTFTQVNLPFEYFKKKESDQLTLIHQGGYKVYDIEKSQNQVAVIGSLRPCIGIVVTDGKRLIAFHKHSTNSVKSMENIIRENLDFSSKEKLLARIYTTRDDVEWKKNSRSIMHGGKTHIEEVKFIKDHLEKMGMIRQQILAERYNMRDEQNNLKYPDYFLGKYDLAELCIAVRLDDIFLVDEKKKIKFFSIDPFTEDVFRYEGKMVSYEEYFGPNLIKVKHLLRIKNYSEPFINYSEIPKKLLEETKQTNGYQTQRGICELRLNKEERENYFKHFHEEESKLMDKPYNSIDFYPLT